MQVTLDMAREFFKRAPFMVDLGVVPVAVGEGRIETEVALAPRHFQHTGQVHAGVMISMADHSMGAAAQMLAPDGFMIITAEIATRLLRAARGERLVCEARVLKPGRLVSFTEADVYVEAGGERVHALRASATMALVGTERLGARA